MSGIAGFIHFDGEPAQGGDLARMLDALSQRGPDRLTLHCAANAGFAKALLATTPEALCETQPWKHPESGCWIVSDSRLDNRPDLIADLRINRAADEVGDAELLHAAWQRWGTSCADRLRGDFAFVIWNPATHELYAARDPMGVRPLAFHWQARERFVFGSSVDAVLAHGRVPTDIDEGRVADALMEETEGIDLTSTFYRSVKRLPPASWLLVCSNGLIRQERYWLPVGKRPSGLPRNEDEWVEAQHEQLDHAVKRRLRSQRPVGSMLSGGLDSSSVVALASRACFMDGRPPLPVYSATNQADQTCTETRSIKEMLANRHCKPFLIDLASIDAWQAGEWWNLCMEPFDGSITLASCLYRAASSHGIVSLMDGIPADNLFVTGRYARRLFWQGSILRAWQVAVDQWSLPGIDHPRRQALRVLAGCLAPEAVHKLRAQWLAANEFQALLANALGSQELKQRVNMRKRYRRYRSSLGNSHIWHPLDEALSSMTAPYITAGIERFNRVASIFGVEPRPPFADRDLIEFQSWVPIGLRLREGHPKWILRKAMSSLLPDKIAWRADKSHIGWAFNQAVLARQLKAAASTIPEQPLAQWVDERKLASAIRNPREGSSSNLAAAWRLLMWARNRSSASSFKENDSHDVRPENS
ncbi:MAG: asparagine synthase-related protein [Burkholderiaceae bacterium]